MTLKNLEVTYVFNFDNRSITNDCYTDTVLGARHSYDGPYFEPLNYHGTNLPHQTIVADLVHTEVGPTGGNQNVVRDIKYFFKLTDVNAYALVWDYEDGASMMDPYVIFLDKPID